MLDHEQDGATAQDPSAEEAAAHDVAPPPVPSESPVPPESPSDAAPPPRRRRSASRPAGPPSTAPEPVPPTPDEGDGAQPTLVTSPEPGAEDTPSKPARKAATKRAPRAKTASAEGEAPPPRKRAPRKTAPAAPQVVGEGLDPNTEPRPDQVEAPAEQPDLSGMAVDPFAVPELDMAPVTAAPEAVRDREDTDRHADLRSDQAAPSAGEPLVSGEVPAGIDFLHVEGEQRWSGDEAEGPQNTAAGEVDLGAAPVLAQDATLDDVVDGEAGADDEAFTLTVDESAAEPVDEESADEESSDEEDGEDAADEEPGSDEGGARRRRRRRGGRRRRRTGDGEVGVGAEDAEEGGSEESAEAPTPADEAVDESADSGEEDAGEGEGEGEGQHRRRRRRRRRGEEPAAAVDDPADVVVRVREPRTRRKASNEVTGIDGSTRMEAKRQRRREGREAGRRRTPILSEAEFLARREAVARRMVIRQREDLTQIAVLEDDILVEHYVDRDSAASLIGNVYLGRVQNVLPSMEAAFIDIGRGRNAVLYAGEVDWDSFGANGPDRKVEKVLKSGQTILVQVSKDPVGAKGARLTNHVSIPGRYIVYAPGGHLSGISRKLPDVERKRLKDILADHVGDSASVIVRTAAEGASEDELVRDVNRLKAQWADIEKKVKAGQAPQLLYGEPDLTLRIVRDLFTEDFSELVIAGNGGSKDAYEAVTAYVTHIAPHLSERIVRWDRDEDPFAAYRLDEQIAKGLERKVFLPSGGSLVIDRTEAMTVIDVNTGKFTGAGGNLEATVTSNNLEAAEEIVRQLRLRDIGGIIVIDFIDMVLPSNRELLLRRLVECLGRDRTRHQVAEVTSLGLVQMTRKRIGTGLLEAFTSECPACHGSGVELHAMPVESQRQADGGTRERGRSRGGGATKPSPRSGGRRGDEEVEGVEEPAVGDTGAEPLDVANGSSDQPTAADGTSVPVEGDDAGAVNPGADVAAAPSGEPSEGAAESGERRPRSRRRRSPRSSEPAPVG